LIEFDVQTEWKDLLLRNHIQYQKSSKYPPQFNLIQEDLMNKLSVKHKICLFSLS